MPDEHEVHVKRAADFAEIAEALGVETTSIFAVRNPGRETFFVLYSPDPDDPERIFNAQLKRGVDGILFRSAEDVEIPGLWDQIKQRADLELPKLIEEQLDQEQPGWRDLPPRGREGR